MTSALTKTHAPAAAVVGAFVFAEIKQETLQSLRALEKDLDQAGRGAGGGRWCAMQPHSTPVFESACGRFSTCFNNKKQHNMERNVLST